MGPWGAETRACIPRNSSPSDKYIFVIQSATFITRLDSHPHPPNLHPNPPTSFIYTHNNIRTQTQTSIPTHKPTTTGHRQPGLLIYRRRHRHPLLPHRRAASQDHLPLRLHPPEPKRQHINPARRPQQRRAARAPRPAIQLGSSRPPADLSTGARDLPSQRVWGACGGQTGGRGLQRVAAGVRRDRAELARQSDVCGGRRAGGRADCRHLTAAKLAAFSTCRRDRRRRRGWGGWPRRGRRYGGAGVTRRGDGSYAGCHRHPTVPWQPDDSVGVGGHHAAR